MVTEKSLAVYKSRPALVSVIEGEKINIAVLGGESYKVREKDIETIHPGPCSLKDMEAPPPSGSAREAWELLLDENEAPPSGSENSSNPVTLKELTELIFGDFTPRAAFAAWEILHEKLYFSGECAAIKPRSRADVEADEKKRDEKQRETIDRAAFLEKLKKLFSRGADSRDGTSKEFRLTEAERRFLYDTEALALGKSDKSRTLKELGKSESREEAHKLLLASGMWTVWVNPHPARHGIGLVSALALPGAPPQEERVDLTGLAAYAIDNAWSNDPDDAVSVEGTPGEDGFRVWVHVADPAASVLPDSPCDLEARGRGTTLYLPEGAYGMLSPEALPLFALGYTESEKKLPASPALSIKLTLDKNLAVSDVEIIPSFVKVTRLSYGEADDILDGKSPGKNSRDSSALAALRAFAERNTERRLDTGAVIIDLPDVHISVLTGEKPEDNSVSVESEKNRISAEIVRECMILAGEGAARWALQRQLPFPYISQEAGELPAKRLPSLAGAWQLRRCMRPRALSVKPAVHWGLGLDAYTQVTSPLRRYTDLLCHQQIRLFLRGEKPLSEEDVLFRVSAGEAAASQAARAERASKAHWMAVYLSGKKDSLWDAVVLDRKGARGTVMIPALGLETQLNLAGNEEPNDKIQAKLLSVKVPECEITFGR